MRGAREKRLMFLQLPLPDNDPRGRRENVAMAAFYLSHAVERSSESKHWRMFLPDFQTLEKSDSALLAVMARWKPDVLALTLYLWNVERSLRLAALAKQRRPSLKVVVGGPEVAADHPFLFEASCVDAAVYGEGEPVFPHVLRALRQGTTTDFSNVAWRKNGAFVWGRNPPPAFDLTRDLPAAAHPGWRPDGTGMAYLETIRGCPLRCAFCCYGQRRHRISVLPGEEVERRVRVLLKRGARDLRFVDPTFNARPDFDDLLIRLARANKGRKVELFAELRAETITAPQARTMARAGFCEVEVGMQSRDADTLRLIRRPTRLPALDRGIRFLTRAGLRVTVDLMYGLPKQTLGDIRRMLRWAARLRRVRVQCLQTLLLPGTELRARRHEWDLRADSRPPYAVRSSATLAENEMRAAEEEVQRRLRIVWDCPTQQFVSRSLPDLFPERFDMELTDGARCRSRYIRPKTHRCALIIRGRDFFQRRADVKQVINRAVEAEPYALWQFVLGLEEEEPLDLLDDLARAVHKMPEHVLDRFIQLHSPDLRAARRVLVWLLPGRRFSRDWQEAAEELLRAYFY